MSDSWLKFVPTDPTARPSSASADQAVQLLESFAPEADSVSARFTEKIEFVDPGGNWSGVACAKCGADVELWWRDAMDRAHSKSFDDLRVITPCCGEATSLNELRYVAPAGFARFVIESLNPNINDLTEQQQTELANCLRLPLRKIWVRL